MTSSRGGGGDKVVPCRIKVFSDEILIYILVKKLCFIQVNHLFGQLKSSEVLKLSLNNLTANDLYWTEIRIPSFLTLRTHCNSVKCKCDKHHVSLAAYLLFNCFQIT